MGHGNGNDFVLLRELDSTELVVACEAFLQGAIQFFEIG